MNIQSTCLVVAGFALAVVACSGNDAAEPVSGPSETTASSPTFSEVAVDPTSAGNDPALDEFSTYLTKEDEDEEEKCWAHRLLDNGHIGFVEVECKEDEDEDEEEKCYAHLLQDNNQVRLVEIECKD